MALSMEEQRILTQIEVRLSEDDPRLAHRLARLGDRGPGRGRRVRVIAAASVAVLAVVAAIAIGIATAIT
ncbi:MULTISPECIES: DUF3040 domain-containing protein [Actinomadura]|uniref:DUF3040 domain-containing protein n=1 Tax=Actinomadura TaxID=1988 RepID=UPI0003FFDFD8|nr:MULTISPECIES: DUF3040 domain-containing protein [Actinomadura]RSN41052.1 DUF3040 domain-containing protein [Actinomadura sp. WAC 06369]